MTARTVGARSPRARKRDVRDAMSGHVPPAASHLHFLRAVAAELLLRDPDGSRLDRVDDSELLARETAAHAIDSADSWQAHLGAFYDVEGVRRLLSRAGQPVTKQAVSKRKSLLALTTGSGRVVYPSFQFVDGSPTVGFDRLLADLPEHLVSRWTVASWLVSPQGELGGQRPVDLLRQGAIQPVLSVARDWAHGLAA